MNLDDRLCLALGLGEWVLYLRGGGLITLRAHAYSLEGTELVFSLLIDASPAFYVDVFRIPEELVQRVDGGLALP